MLSPGTIRALDCVGRSRFSIAEKSRRSRILLAAFFALGLAGCEREEREYRLDPPLAADLDKIKLMPNGISGAAPESYYALGQPYESNA